MFINPEKLITAFFYCGIFGSLVFILKTSLPFDSGAEVQSDFTSMADTDSSFSLFTIESISAFFMAGGWMGWLALSSLSYTIKMSLGIAVLSGFIAMVFFSWLISKFRKLEHVPKISLKEVEGREGKAYLRFSPKGNGKIQIEFNSKLEILDAKNDTNEEINAFESIKVVRVENDTIYISKN